MQNRQSGAAHVPIMFFLILLLMFLGALGFAYVQQTKNSELAEARQKAVNDLQAIRSKDVLVEDYVKAIGDVIGKPGQYKGEPGRSARYGDATIDYPGLMNPTEVKEVMTKAAADARVSEASSLENLLGAMVTKINAQEQRIKDIELERDKALADYRASNQRFSQTESAANTAASETASNLEQARSDFESARVDRDSRISQLSENLRAKSDEITQVKEEFEVERKKFQRDIDLLQAQLSAMTERAKLLQPPDVADGKVLVAENGLPTAFIDLGRKDMLQPGTVFRVKSRGSSDVKGYAQVTRVEDERAEVRLYDFVDPVGDYARQGDLLYNDLYTPRVTRTIYLLGRFGAPYDKEQLSNLLRRLGNRVVTKMGPGVDLVVLGNKPINESSDGFDDIEQLPEFKMAQKLRVEFTYLPKIADLVRF